MTEEQIRKSIGEGLIVHWSNPGYVVSVGRGSNLMITFTSTGYYSRLQPEEYYQCFVEIGE